MSSFPVLKSKEVVKILLKAEFEILRQSGSHIRLRHILDSTRQTTVPLHNNDVPRWLLGEILKQAKINTKDFLNLLK